MSAIQNDHFVFGSVWPQENIILCFNSQTQTFNKIEIDSNIKINNWSCATPFQDGEIILTGGLMNTGKKISNETLLFNTQTLQITPLANFNQCRYVHQCVYHKEKLFLMGGRQYGPDFESVLSHCEVYEDGIWKQIAPMTKRRSNFNIFLYQDQIHCIGGFDGKKNTKSIEYYDENKQIWVKSKIRLPRGLAGFQLIPLQNQKILIIGGMTLQGPSQSCIQLNLETNCSISYSSMVQIRSLFHMLKTDDGNYIVYGGMNKANTFEIFNYELKNWEEIQINIDENIQNLRGMTSTQCLCIVDEQVGLNQQLNNQEYDPDDVVFLFGNDEYPFILPLPKYQTNLLEPLEIPFNLSLYSYMSICSIDPELPGCRQIVLSGGIDSKISIINRKAYLVTIMFPNMKLKVKKIGKLSYHRYAAACVYNAPYVYVIGGRGYQNDMLSLHSTVERFNIDDEIWDQVAPLNEAKCSLTASVIGDKVYVFGGYVGDGQISHKIECLNGENWEILNIELPFSLEGLCSIVLNDSDVFIFGGKGFDGSKKEIIKFNIGDLESNYNVSGSVIGNMQHSRSLPKLIALNDNSILVLGGYFFDNPNTNFGEIYGKQNYEEYLNIIELTILQLGANDQLNMFSITN